MKYSREFIRFNQGIIFGEVGALIGVPLAPMIASRFTANAAVLSSAAVIGGLVLGSAFWLIVNVGHEQAQAGDRSAVAKNIAQRIAWFTPAAFLISLVTYHPVIWLVSYSLLRRGTPALWAGLTAEALAFALFLSAMNLYRLALHRLTTVRI